MEDFESRIPDNSRVRLRDYISPTFYQNLAKSGNEGWIRKHRKGRFGLPEVFIEWDREHWADNLQPNQWTYEEHFDVLEEGTTMTDDISPGEWEAFQQFRKFQSMQESQNESKESPEQIKRQIEQEHRQHYLAQIERAENLMKDSEAFFLCAVVRQPSNPNDAEAPDGAMVVSTAGSSLTPESDYLVGMQLGSVANQFHKEAALTLMQEIMVEEDTDGG